jgi:pilus assembly protein CpaB
MRKPGTILLLALVIGALAAAVVYRNLQNQRAEIDAARRANSNQTVDVVIATARISLGSRIAADQVKVVRWPADIEPKGTAHGLDGVVNAVARTTIEPSQPVFESLLVKEPSGLLPLIISEGMRAMSVKVDNVTGVSGFITPNSRVDVLVAGKPEGNAEDERSKLILQNVKVLATGTSIEQIDDKPVEVPTVTLLVSPGDAEKMTLATHHAPVRLALRNYRDEELVGTSGISAKALFAGAEPKVAGAARPPRRPAPPPRPTIDLLLGEKLIKVAL